MNVIVGILLLSSAINVWANNTIDSLDWRLQKAQSGIAVYSAKVPDSEYKAILATVTIQADIDELVAFVRDPEQCTRWVYRCKQSYRYDSLDAQQEYIYTSSNMPFPVKNRDVLALIKWQKDPVTNTVTSTGTATEDILEEDEGHVRITDATVIWEFTPVDGGEVNIRSYTHLDPAGGIPAWLNNTLAVDMPLKTLSRLKKVLEQP